MSAISIREKGMERRQEGRSIKEIADFLKIHVRTIQYWVKRFEKEGTLAPNTHRSRHRKIDKTHLSSFVSQHPDKTLKEIGHFFKVTPISIFSSLKKMSITLKKRP